VLYIEDNEVNRLLMEGMLAQRPQLRLSMAALPLEGLAMALQERPDLLLLDIQLPGIDGFEVLRRLRAHEASQGLPPMPVVAVSANAMPADRDKAVQAGFADYITKPIELPLLLATLDRLLA
jgi:CheY-like chemotaxis protein